MVILKRNIWLLFFLILLTSTVLLASLSLSRWNSLTQFHNVSQQGTAAQWFVSFSSILEQQEAIITLIGEKLVDVQPKDFQAIQAQLDELMNLNPDFFSGFALVAPAGEVLVVSSNLEQNNVVNLRDLPQARDSFIRALESEKMVLGRTYLAPRLVIPARKAIRDNDGKVLAVMTGALSLLGPKGFFSNNRVLGKFNRITILRNSDRYLQYSTDGELIPHFHEHPMDEAAYHRLKQAIMEQAGNQLSAPEGNVRQVSFSWDTQSERGIVRAVAMYNPRYEFWLISEIEEHYLIREFINIFATYLVIMLAFQIAMFLLFRYIDRAEKEQRKALMFQASHDPLTQLPNRNYLLSTFAEWTHEKTGFSLLFIDLDNFKGINDNFGHSIGDGLLIELAKRLNATIDDNELLVRHGGDEFVLLTAGLPQEANEERVAKLIYKSCENIQALGMTFSPSCSIGIARFPEHGTQLDELLRASDIAMYEAKKQRNSVNIFRPNLEEQYLFRVRIEQMLRSAVDNDEIFLTYQPQVDALGHLCGVEALVRWQQPELGLVPPDQFIGVAEQSGRMNKLGEYIIDQSLSQIRSLYQRHKRAFRLSINISIRQFAEEKFATNLLEKIQHSGIPRHLICLEITENLLVDDLDHMRSILQKLHHAGIRIALDDFGTGYSSLGILRDLPIDELKIDKSFVDNILWDQTSLKMVKNIISIGKLYNMDILAEGVETQEQMQVLKNCGCDLFQGYLFSHPVTIAGLETYIRGNSPA